MAVPEAATLYTQRVAAAAQAALRIVSCDAGVQRKGERRPFSACDLLWHWEQRGDDKYLVARIETDALPWFQKGEGARLDRGEFVRNNVKKDASGELCYFKADCPHSGTPAVKAEAPPPAGGGGARPASAAGPAAEAQAAGGSKQRGAANVLSKKVGSQAVGRDVRCTADVIDDRGSTASLKETVFSSAQA